MQQNVARCRDGERYSKSADVNANLGFAWTSWPPLCMDGPPPCFYSTARSFVMPFRDTLHHPYICPCFWRKHFYAPFILYIY